MKEDTIQRLSDAVEHVLLDRVRIDGVEDARGEPGGLEGGRDLCDDAGLDHARVGDDERTALAEAFYVVGELRRRARAEDDGGGEAPTDEAHGGSIGGPLPQESTNPAMRPA